MKKTRLMYSDDTWDYGKDTTIEVYDAENDDYKEVAIKDLDSDDEYEFLNSELEYFKEECDGCAGGNIKKNYYYVVDGYFGGWMGHQAGGFVSGKELFDVIRDCCVDSSSSSLKVELVGNELVVTNAHHDGKSMYTIKALTKKGEQWYLNHKYDDRKYVVKHLWNTKGYTRNVTFFD